MPGTVRVRGSAAAGLLLTLLWAASCAGPADGGARERAPRASDGWLELVIRDAHVPADPLGDPGASSGGPPPCEVELELGGEPVLARALSPQGDAPPFTVNETLRTALPPGDHRGTLYYSGCRTAWGQLDGRDVSVVIEVRTGYVTRVEFDGSTLLTYPPDPL
jgi:hypothetical protein